MVDENIPSRTVKALKASGHDVKDIRGTKEEGISDDRIWELAQKESRIIITTDKGFVQRRNENHHGILAVCLKQPNRTKIHQRILIALAKFPEGKWSGLLVIMKDTIQSIYRSRKR